MSSPVCTLGHCRSANDPAACPSDPNSALALPGRTRGAPAYGIAIDIGIAMKMAAAAKPENDRFVRRAIGPHPDVAG